MLWHLNNPDAGAARSLFEEQGRTVPESLCPPDRLEGFGGWLETFWELDTERQVGMTIGYIPVSKIRQRCAGWPDAGLFVSVMRRLDRAYVDWIMNSKGRSSETHISAQPVSDKIFDAMFGSGG